MPVTVVVVDDDAEFRLMVGYMLTADPMVKVVGEAGDGEQALEVVRRERPDLVLTDLVMPKLDGIGLTRQVRQELPQTRVIVMSSFTEDDYHLMASDSGADAFITKKVIFRSLLPAIHDVIRRFLGGHAPRPDGSSAAASP